MLAAICSLFLMPMISGTHRFSRNCTDHWRQMILIWYTRRRKPSVIDGWRLRISLAKTQLAAKSRAECWSKANALSCHQAPSLEKKLSSLPADSIRRSNEPKILIFGCECSLTEHASVTCAKYCSDFASGLEAAQAIQFSGSNVAVTSGVLFRKDFRSRMMKTGLLTSISWVRRLQYSARAARSA